MPRSRRDHITKIGKSKAESKEHVFFIQEKMHIVASMYIYILILYIKNANIADQCQFANKELLAEGKYYKLEPSEASKKPNTLGYSNMKMH